MVSCETIINTKAKNDDRDTKEKKSCKNETHDVAMIVETTESINRMSNVSPDTWVADKTSTRPVCIVQSWFRAFKVNESVIQVRKSDHVSVLGTGQVYVKSKVEGKVVRINLQNLLLAPDMVHSSISISQARRKITER